MDKGIIVVMMVICCLCLISSSAGGGYYYYYKTKSSTSTSSDDSSSSDNSSSDNSSSSSSSSSDSSSSITWKTGAVTSTAYDQQARDCTALGGVYTGGTNTNYSGCDNAWCCVPSTTNWISGKSTSDYTWKGGSIDSSNSKYDQQARDCTALGGVYTGGTNTKFPGCGGNWCCVH